MNKYRDALERLQDHTSQLKPYRVVGDYPNMETTDGDFGLILKLVEFYEGIVQYLDDNDSTVIITQQELEDLLWEII